MADEKEEIQSAQTPQNEAPLLEEPLNPPVPPLKLALSIDDARKLSEDVYKEKNEELIKELETHKRLIEFNFNITSLILVVLGVGFVTMLVSLAAVILTVFFNTIDTYNRNMDYMNTLQQRQQSLENRTNQIENSLKPH